LTALKLAFLGECMIELSEQAPGLLAQGFAGDTYNTAVYLRRLVPAERMQIDYATGVGSDMFAGAMLQAWQQEGIGHGLVQHVPSRSTGLYSIRTDAQGERHFSYWRDTSAARAYFDAASSPLEDQAAQIDVLYLSGISLAVMASALPSRLPALLARLKAQGARIVFDNNYRPRLWASPEAARAAFDQLFSVADIALLTLDDHAALYGAGAREHALALPCAEVVVKQGALPTLVRQGRQPVIEVPVEPVKRPVDTTAAGDSFAAGYLAQRLRGSPAEAAASLGNRLAATVIQHPGAIIPREAMAWAIG
jgi:2-dehydro-3-deoxygluconokinase